MFFAAQRAAEKRAALPMKRKGRFLRKYFKSCLTCNIFVIYNKHEQKRRAIDFEGRRKPAAVLPARRALFSFIRANLKNYMRRHHGVFSFFGCTLEKISERELFPARKRGIIYKTAHIEKARVNSKK